MKFPLSISVAPMLDLTDRHCRAFFRQFSPHVRMYSEMVVTGSVIHGDRDRFLGFDECEHPVAIQLGGCDPEKLAFCAELAEERGYDEVNLNIGCPSDRVKSAQFGACLMAKPGLVADCVAAMIDRVTVPVSVKTRLGIDDQDSYEFLMDFVGQVTDAGCRKLLVHARKAWLHGLSPKENRTVPPLHYDRVYRLKRDFPDIEIIINGGITAIEEVREHLENVDGVMIGREAYQNPWFLRELNDAFFDGQGSPRDRLSVVEGYMPYVRSQLANDVYLRHMTRHMLGTFHGQGGAKGWRRYLSENGPRKDAGLEVIEQALEYVRDKPQVEVNDMNYQLAAG